VEEEWTALSSDRVVSLPSYSSRFTTVVGSESGRRMRPLAEPPEPPPPSVYFRSKRSVA
jgi:hypothetical protein